MKRLLVALAVAVCLMVPVIAQDSTPHPAKGDEQFVGDITWQYVGSERTRRFDGTWFHMGGDRQKAGVSMFGQRQDGLNGTGIGPSYQVMLARFPKGALWGGGTVFALGSSAADAATGRVTLEVNYELYLGRVGALRIGGRYSEALDVKDPALVTNTDGIYDMFLGFGIFVNEAATVN